MVTEIFDSIPNEMKKTADEVFEKAKSALSEERFAHSLRVAQTAAALCAVHKIPVWRGGFAGIAHDICKEIGSEEMKSLALLDGRPFSELEEKKPNLLHGRAAASVLKRDYSVFDSDILDAVAFHTFGQVGLCDLGKIVFVADKIEPGRPQSTNEYRARLFSLSIGEMTLSVLDENIEFLASKGKKAAPESIAWADFLRKELRK